MTSARSSLASLNKAMMPKTSPMKTAGGAEEAKGGKTTPGSSRIGGIGAGRIGGIGRTTVTSAQSAKQQEIAAKSEVLKQNRTIRNTAGTAQKPGMSRQGTVTAGNTSARGVPGRVSARPGGVGATATATRTTLGSRTTAAAKAEEEKKVAPGLAKRPTMSTSTIGGSAMKRTGSALRGSSNTRSTIGSTAVSPKRTGAAERANQGSTRPAASSRMTAGVRDRTPGPANNAITSKATPMELRKLENAIKDKDTEITK